MKFHEIIRQGRYRLESLLSEDASGYDRNEGKKSRPSKGVKTCQCKSEATIYT